MGRPKSDTVDYFSHDCDASGRKTLTIIRGQFGLTGVGFWWSLLEYLGRSQGHVYDARDISDLEFLLREIGIDLVSGTEILDKLAFLGAIDKILWAHRVIWSQNFADRLGDVYEKRKRPRPQKPNFCDENCNHPNTNSVILGTKTQSAISEKTAQSALKTWCRNATNHALNKGLITKKPCEVCGETKVEAHHEDYNDPYRVNWLCEKHHPIADAKLVLAQNVSVTETPQSKVKYSILPLKGDSAKRSPPSKEEKGSDSKRNLC